MPVQLGKELTLPFDRLIGGPLQAIVQSQAMAANTTMEFIDRVGLQDPANEGDPREVRMVTFSFLRSVPDGETVKTEVVTLNVPLLTIVPVPFIRVERATIDLEIKVSSATLSETDSSLGVNAEASGGFFGVKFKVNASYSRQSKFKDQINRSATMTVHLEAVQDEIPGGMAKVLEILETAVNDLTPAAA